MRRITTEQEDTGRKKWNRGNEKCERGRGRGRKEGGGRQLRGKKARQRGTKDITQVVEGKKIWKREENRRKGWRKWKRGKQK